VKLLKSSTNFSHACVLCMKVAKLEVAHGLRLSLLFFYLLQYMCLWL